MATTNTVLHGLSAAAHGPARVRNATSKPTEFLDLHRYAPAHRDFERFANAALAAMSQLKYGLISGWCRASMVTFTSYSDLEGLSLISRQIVIIVRTVASAGEGRSPSAT